MSQHRKSVILNGKVRNETVSAAARRYIQEHIAGEITLDTLAAQAGMSRGHFLYRYKAETGRTTMQDVREMRAHYARQLIVFSKAPLKEIAKQVGLDKGPMLYEAFRKVFNRTPAQYRKRV